MSDDNKWSVADALEAMELAVVLLEAGKPEAALMFLKAIVALRRAKGKKPSTRIRVGFNGMIIVQRGDLTLFEESAWPSWLIEYARMGAIDTRSRLDLDLAAQRVAERMKFMLEALGHDVGAIEVYQ